MTNTDGNALFHANHKNLAGAGAALDVSSVGAARAAMAKQTGLDKKTVLNVRPAFLIVPASLELKAEQLVAQNLVPAATSSVVPQSIRTLAPISEPRLDAASETVCPLADRRALSRMRQRTQKPRFSVCAVPAPLRFLLRDGSRCARLAFLPS